MPATVIAERIGWERGITILRDRVAELRPLFVPPDPCQRTSYVPGELAQWDLWQPDVEIPLGFGQADKLWVVSGVSGFSRLHGGWMVPSRAAHDVLGGMLQVLEPVRGGAPHARCGIRRVVSASGVRAARSSPASSRRSAGRWAWGCDLVRAERS